MAAAATVPALTVGWMVPTVRPAAASDGIDPQCLDGRVVCIDKTTHTLRWIVEGETRMTMPVRFGPDRKPTREGAFAIQWKDAEHVSSLTHEPMPWSMFFSGGEAIHYSPDFAENGYDGASSGCVDTADEHATEDLYNATDVGDTVIVYRS